jgi:pimeloyl-ACP methyl ester carboxylesterase
VKRRFRIALVAVGAVIALCLSSASSAGAATFTPGPCPDQVLDPPSKKALRGARCGTLVVPENRARPTGRTIRLAVGIIPALIADKEPDPIVFLNGGPGSDSFNGPPGYMTDPKFNYRRDVIFMSQRGHLTSRPTLMCPEFDRIGPRLARVPMGDPSTGRLYEQAARECRARLTAQGIDLSSYNTQESAADFADLRRALGLRQWNVLGHSYGTDLAQIYMKEHPEGIRSVQLDGVVPPSEVSVGWPWSTQRFSTDHIFRACVAQPNCDRRYPRLRSTYHRLVRELDRKPLKVPVRLEDGRRLTTVLDGVALVNWIVPKAHFAPEIPAALDQLAEGRPDKIATEWAEGRVAPAKTFAEGLSLSVACREWLPYESLADQFRKGREAFPDFPRRVLAQPPQHQFFREKCRVWNVPAGPASIREIVRSPIETLTTSGSFDGQTGAQWAAFVADRLPNSHQLLVPGTSHGTGFVKRCGQGASKSFFNNPSAPDLHCEPAPRVRAFELEKHGCFTRRANVGRRGIGRIRLGRSRAGLLRRATGVSADPIRRTRHSLRWCVKRRLTRRRRGRVTATFRSAARSSGVQLITSTVRGMGNGRVRVGSSAARVRRAYPARRGLGGGLFQARPGSRRIVGLRRGKVRFVGVASRRLLRNRAALRRALRRAGVRG